MAAASVLDATGAAPLASAITLRRRCSSSLSNAGRGAGLGAGPTGAMTAPITSKREQAWRKATFGSPSAKPSTTRPASRRRCARGAKSRSRVTSATVSTWPRCAMSMASMVSLISALFLPLPSVGCITSSMPLSVQQPIQRARPKAEKSPTAFRICTRPRPASAARTRSAVSQLTFSASNRTAMRASDMANPSGKPAGEPSRMP